MQQTESLTQFMKESDDASITAVANYIGRHIRNYGEAVFHDNEAKLRNAYEEAGDAAYGTYLNLLFLPVHKQLKEAGLSPEPRLPGDFDISREWGNEEESDQQRWMWSTIKSRDGEAAGTIVTIVYHDHTQFRIPRLPEVIALAESGKEDVIAALSLRSPEFAEALEFTEEYALYLKSMENEE